MNVTDSMETQVERLAELVSDVARESDHALRAVLAQEAWVHIMEQVVPTVAAVRRVAVRELRANGHTWKEVADALGVSESRAVQLSK